ncbi:hypothetical protein GWK47_015867 [Chionoecetes opilio]|uniref:Uncharacterized protein n=1 Tax=Chionoecetes opilio TaxID=41210 RepID=A0A8J4XRS9_CHIOP|nr:hypothetical protein GWK47_015867 [Chionoecetes opilio]
MVQHSPGCGQEMAAEPTKKVTFNEIEEVYRLGKFEEGGARPMKVKFLSQITLNELMNKTCKLAGKEKFTTVWLRRDMKEEERATREQVQGTTRPRNKTSRERRRRQSFTVMNNVMTQWVDQETRFPGEDTPARLDLLFTKETGFIYNLENLSLFGKSDHLVLEFEITEDIVEPKDHRYRKGRYSYRKVNFEGFQKFFTECN